MLVIGNGESRLPIDLTKITREKVGCNAIYRDMHVDHLVCVDLKTLEEAKEHHKNIYTRTDWYPRYQNFQNISTVPMLPYKGLQRWDDPWHWGSGPYAVLLAATLTKINRVDLVGFDLYSDDGLVNNVYKGTSNYSQPSKRAVDPRYWIYQIGKVFECYSKVEFVLHQKDNWQIPELWKKSNVRLDSISILSYYKTTVD